MTTKNANPKKTKNHSSRRAFIHKLSIALGSTAAYSLLAKDSLAVAFAYRPDKNTANKVGKVFNQHQMLMLKHISDIILPQTETPSGSSVDCHGFVDNQIKHCHSKKSQLESIKILQLIDKYSKRTYKNSFNDLSTKQQMQTLENIEALKGFSKLENKHFKLIKSLVVYGYFTSEVGATQALNYQAIPNGFKGSITYTKESKAWGSLAYY